MAEKVKKLIPEGFEVERSESDDTRRLRRIIASDPNMQSVKRLHFWFAMGLLAVGIGWGGREYFSNYPTLDDLAKVQAAQVATQKALDAHLVDAASKDGSTQARMKDIEEDYHYQSQQLRSIADHVGAPRIPLPSHLQNK